MRVAYSNLVFKEGASVNDIAAVIAAVPYSVT